MAGPMLTPQPPSGAILTPSPTSAPMPTPPPAGTTFAGLNFGIGSQVSPSLVNSYRISAVAERLAAHVNNGVGGSSTLEFFNLCLSLSRGIDYAVANNEVPTKIMELPVLLKQICQQKNDPFLQAAVMVLMISVKNVCKIGWFPSKEAEELCSLANELGRVYCSLGNVNSGSSKSHNTISRIMERFYPCMKMGQILASLEVQPGYGTYLVDFHILKNTQHSPQEKIRLFVAQTDNIETSACIISPQQVNFLLNGKGVEKRTNIFLDSGPQIPSNVTAMLKYGTNLLQAVGHFNGHYIILVAFMSVTPSPESPMLQGYVRPVVTEIDSDAEIIEGPSRISLNCPISYTRIKTPVKGQSCKHLQCFDFNNFVDINARRPSWRCPHCNQHVCYLDIRIDQNMVEVLKEVGEDVAEVIICADGSWKAVMENDDPAERTQNKIRNPDKEQTELPELPSSEGVHTNVLDLTADDDWMDIAEACVTEDVKPFLGNNQNLPIHASSTSSGINSTVGVIQNAATRVEDNFWSGLHFAHSSVSSGGGLDSHAVDSLSEHNTTNFTHTPVLADSISPAFNREAGVRGNGYITNSSMQSQVSLINTNLQLQQYSYLTSSSSNEYGRSSNLPRHITRAPTAVQALPAPSQPTVPQQRLRTSLNSMGPSCSTSTPQVSLSIPACNDGMGAILSDIERQQHFSLPRLSPVHVSEIPPSALRHNSASQNQTPAVAGVPASSKFATVYKTPSTSSHLSDLRNPHLQQALNPRSYPSPMTSQTTSAMRSHLQRTVAQVGNNHTVGSPSTQHTRVMTGSQMVRPSPPFSVQNQTTGTHSSYAIHGLRTSAAEQRANTGVTLPSVSRTKNLLDFQSEQNWRPTGRMRGSITGRAISAGLDHLIIQPTQSTQPSQSPRIQPSQSTQPSPSQSTRVHPTLPTQLSQGARTQLVSPSLPSPQPRMTK